MHAKARWLSPAKLAIAWREFEEMEKLGIVRRSSSTWSSPLHMVEKKAPGTWRPCGDYRRLNEATTHDRYPVPHIQDFSAQLEGKTIFSKVDMVRGYNQIPVAAADVPKTAVMWAEYPTTWLICIDAHSVYQSRSEMDYNTIRPF